MPTKKEEAPYTGKLTKAEIAALAVALYEGLCRSGFGYESIVAFGKCIYAAQPIQKLDTGSIGHLAKTIAYLDTSGALDFLRTPAAAESTTKEASKTNGSGVAASESVKPDKVIPPAEKKDKAATDKSEKNKDGAAQKTE